jgi:hypothetical protein
MKSSAIAAKFNNLSTSSSSSSSDLNISAAAPAPLLLIPETNDKAAVPVLHLLHGVAENNASLNDTLEQISIHLPRERRLSDFHAYHPVDCYAYVSEFYRPPMFTPEDCDALEQFLTLSRQQADLYSPAIRLEVEKCITLIFPQVFKLLEQGEFRHSESLEVSLSIMRPNSLKMLVTQDLATMRDMIIVLRKLFDHDVVGLSPISDIQTKLDSWYAERVAQANNLLQNKLSATASTMTASPTVPMQSTDSTATTSVATDFDPISRIEMRRRVRQPIFPPLFAPPGFAFIKPAPKESKASSDCSEQSPPLQESAVVATESSTSTAKFQPETLLPWLANKSGPGPDVEAHVFSYLEPSVATALAYTNKTLFFKVKNAHEDFSAIAHGKRIYRQIALAADRNSFVGHFWEGYQHNATYLALGLGLISKEFLLNTINRIPSINAVPLLEWLLKPKGIAALKRDQRENRSPSTLAQFFIPLSQDHKSVLDIAEFCFGNTFEEFPHLILQKLFQTLDTVEKLEINRLVTPSQCQLYKIRICQTIVEDPKFFQLAISNDPLLFSVAFRAYHPALQHISQDLLTNPATSEKCRMQILEVLQQNEQQILQPQQEPSAQPGYRV